MNNLLLKISIRFSLAFFIVSYSGYTNAQSSGCINSINFSKNRIDYTTIIPCGATKITLTFYYFNLSSAGLLKVYDGTDASGKPLHPGNGFEYGNPPSSPLVAYSGAIYIYYSSGGTGKDSFIACWTSTLDTAHPVAKFDIQDTIYNLVNYTFKNTSKHIATKTDYIWSIEPDFGEVGYNKDLNFVFKNNKTYDVTLEIHSCIGKDNYTKKVIVITPEDKLNLDFKTKNVKPFVGTIDTFSAINFITRKKPVSADKYIWEFVPDKVSYLNGTTCNSKIIEVKFSEKGKYKVSLKAWNSADSISTITEVIKKDYITVQEPPSPKVYLDIKAKKINLLVGETDTLFAVDSTSGKLFKADRFRWKFNPSTVTYLNGTSQDMKTIQVKFNDTGKYTISLAGWNSTDSSKTYNDTFKTDFITVKKAIIPKACFDFLAKNLNPQVGEMDTLYVIDSIPGKTAKANKFRWQISPNRFTFMNGTNAESKIIQVKFKSEGKYSVTLFGWNSEDSISTYNDTVKVNYLTVKGTVNYKVYLDFKANNLKPKVGDEVTIVAIDSMAGKPYKANRFKWEFLPDNVTYLNGSSSENQTIKIKFNETGKYTVHLTGWNWADSAATFNGTIKADYISVDDTLSSVEKTQAISSLITIYPNPGQGKFNIYYNEGCFEIMSIQIYNSTGKLVNETNGIKCRGSIEPIDLSDEPSGLYTLRILINKSQIIQKISIDR